MRIMLAMALVGSCLLMAAPTQAAVAFLTVEVPNGVGQSTETGLWYPSGGQPRPTRFGTELRSLVPGGPVAGRRLKLIVISHGAGANFAGHEDTAEALAEAGFVVAAPTHAVDHDPDATQAGWLATRTRQVSSTIDYMLATWQPGAVDPHRIGAFGYSAGGLTLLTEAGGVPDARFQHGSSVTRFRHDARIRALVLAAPSIAFGPDDLDQVRVPVQLWRADDDTVLPPDEYADVLRRRLPASPEFHGVPLAGHFDFLPPCSGKRDENAASVCFSAPGFDRAAFHRVFNREVVRFFEATL